MENESVDFSLRDTMLAWEPMFQEAFARYSRNDQMDIDGFKKLMDDCALQKRRPDPYSPTPVLNSTSIFGRVSQDDRLDWAGFWGFFSSERMMKNSLKDYVFMKSALKAWGCDVAQC
eukprot:TRINITY_DN26689_c0_g2_i1.p1 TRINITY_DN26689_c0_g2~~TRINITY_DN26689_c0_g2_i1.p1  ORF type:complete len:117 (+),score=30.14 TRINITY_DN26689_c0_g2_i1:79-429(+)